MSLVRGVVIATRNALKMINVPAYRSAATTSHSLYRGCSCTKTELKTIKLRNADPHTPSGHHFTSEIISPGKSCAVALANRVLENSSSWHPSSEEYCQASGRKMHWRRYGYINHHSPAGHDRSTDSRHWRGQVCCHYESSLWTNYAEIRVTVSSIWSWNTVSTPVLVLSVFPSEKR